MRKWICALAILVAPLVGPQAAHAQSRWWGHSWAWHVALPPVQTLTVVNQAGVSTAQVRQVERAIVLQAVQLRAAWNTPLIRFGKHGWRVYLQPPTHPVYLGMHDFNGGYTGDPLGSHRPEAIVAAVPNWPTILSHETMEMLVDPSAKGLEVCDPVEDQTYSLAGVQVARFVTPAWLATKAGTSPR